MTRNTFLVVIYLGNLLVVNVSLHLEPYRPESNVGGETASPSHREDISVVRFAPKPCASENIPFDSHVC